MMHELFGGITILQGGAGALLGLAILAILTGWLVPRSTLRDVQKERDWLRSSNEEKDRQITELLEVAHTAEQVLSALPKVRDMR